jgi:hypothetical protein
LAFIKPKSIFGGFKTMQKLFSLIFTVLIYFSLSLAGNNPKPLGLELGVATISDAKSKYKLKYEGINKYTLGEMYDLDISRVNIDGVKKITLIFSKDEKLQVVIMDFPKDFNDTYWNRLYNYLKNKYKLIYSRVPFVGSKYAVFKQGNSIIKLNSPHLGFETYIIYMTRDFERLFNQINEEEKRKKKKSLESNL